jgi:hypothetical protein
MARTGVLRYPVAFLPMDSLLLGTDFCGSQSDTTRLAIAPFNTHPMAQTGPLLRQVASIILDMELHGTEPCGLQAGHQVRTSNSAIRQMDRTGRTQYQEEVTEEKELRGTELSG